MGKNQCRFNVFKYLSRQIMLGNIITWRHCYVIAKCAIRAVGAISRDLLCLVLVTLTNRNNTEESVDNYSTINNDNSNYTRMILPNITLVTTTTTTQRPARSRLHHEPNDHTITTAPRTQRPARSRLNVMLSINSVYNGMLTRCSNNNRCQEQVSNATNRNPASTMGVFNVTVKSLSVCLGPHKAYKMHCITSLTDISTPRCKLHVLCSIYIYV